MQNIFKYLIGLSITFYIITVYLKYESVKSWSSIEGKIITIGSNGKSLSIEYNYIVNGVAQTNDEYTPSVFTFFSNSIQNNNKLISTKTEGEECIIYFNPEKIKQSSLTKEYSRTEIVVCLILSIGLFFYFFVLYRYGNLWRGRFEKMESA